MKNKVIILICLVLYIIFAGMNITLAVNVNSILQQAEQSYNQQMSTIQDLTIVQSMEGGFASMENTIYQKRAKVNNEIVYKMRSESQVMGMETIVIFDGIYMWSVNPITGQVQKEERKFDPINVWRMIDPTKAEYLGEEKVEGKNCHKIKAHGALYMMGQENMIDAEQQENTETEIYSLFWIDTRDLVPLRVQNFIKTTKIEEGKKVAMNNIIDSMFMDYRKVGSLLLSHKMVVSNQMDIDDPTLSKEEKEQAMAFMNAMGKMEFVVKGARINTGLSDELFDGTKLEPGEPMIKNMPGMPDMGQGDTVTEGFDPEQLQEFMQNAMEGNEDFKEMMENMMKNN